MLSPHKQEATDPAEWYLLLHAFLFHADSNAVLLLE